MTANHLVLNAGGDIVVDPVRILAEAAAGHAVPVVPVAEHRYGANEAARRAVYVDYSGEQKILNINHVKHSNDATVGFSILDNHCSPTGQAIYRAFLLIDNNYGRFELAWQAITPRD